MKNYIIYIKNTGQILRHGYCPDSDYDIQAQSGEEIMEGIVNSNSYVENGNLISIPPAPNEYCVFDYDTKQWVDPRTNETQWTVVRSQRDALLAASDWTQLLDINIPNKSAWAVYRQNLRDITKQADPFNITWPTQPPG